MLQAGCNRDKWQVAHRNLDNQPQCVARQNQTKRELLFTLHYKPFCQKPFNTFIFIVSELSNARQELYKTKMLLKQAEENTSNLNATRMMPEKKENLTDQKDKTNSK